MLNFHLHPRLQADCLPVGELPLSQLLLMNDSLYPWFILVPRRADISEIHQLDAADRRQLLDESCLLAVAMQSLCVPDKLNVAAIGNLVPQLHVHHVARYRTDASWPAPVWGRLPPQPYAHRQAEARIGRFREALAAHLL